jgi:hypothetical protein
MREVWVDERVVVVVQLVLYQLRTEESWMRWDLALLDLVFQHSVLLALALLGLIPKSCRCP